MEGGFLPGNLDPKAEEFRPRNPCSLPQITLLPPHIYYPCPSHEQVMPFYPSQSSAYVRLPGIPLQPPPPPPPLPLPAPPPSAAPTRALLLSYLPTVVTEETIREGLEAFGEVRTIQMERLQDGIVIVHFYDLRHAQAALAEIQAQHMQQQNRLRLHYSMQPWGFDMENSVVPVPPPGCVGLILGQAIWAQFIQPVSLPLSDGLNQGTIVVFNLDSGVSACQLKEIFDAFGTVKEVRETPLKRNQRFVEYFDIRDAARAMKEMDGKEINGKRVLIEFSRPGGQRSRFSNNSMYTNRSNSFPGIPNYSPPPPQPQPVVFPPKSFRRSNSDASSSNSSGKKPSFGNNSSWKGSNRRAKYRVDASEITTPLASLSVSGSDDGRQKRFHGSSSSSIKNPKKSHNNGNNNSIAASNKQQGKQQQQQGRSSSSSTSNRSWKGRHKSFDSHFLIKEDAIFESKCLKDTRTTVMIKNIPNKYSQKLLLNMLDNHCINCNEQIGDGDDQPLSSYDFVYLPIDFNNKCNVGYGFVNLTSPEATWRLYKAFHLQHWEVFNSRKICEITYARLQGLEALKEHFKNSKFACETDEYLPVLFSPPRDGKHLTEPIPIGGHTNTTTSTTITTTTTTAFAGSVGKEDEEEWLLHGHDDEDDGGGGDGDGGKCFDGNGNDGEGDLLLRSSSCATTSTITSTSSTCGDGSTNGCFELH